MYCHNSVNFHFHISVCEWAGQNFVTFTRVKLCRRPEVNNEPAHFLTFMKNGVAFPSLGWHAAYQCPDQFQLLPGHWPAKRSWISWDFRKPDTLENNPSNTRNNMKSQIKKKELKYCFVELLIPALTILAAIRSYLSYWKGKNMNIH